MLDFMIDIETTGTVGSKHAILQIGCIPFDLKKMIKSKTGFCAELTIPKNRVWEPSTQEWWQKTNPSMLKTILSEGQPYHLILKEFKFYVEAFKDEVMFWSHHTLDWEFINSYYEDYGIKNPFRYNCFRDVDSFIHGVTQEDNIKQYQPVLDEAKEHNALYDCDWQIDWIFNSIKSTKK